MASTQSRFFTGAQLHEIEMRFVRMLTVQHDQADLDAMRSLGFEVVQEGQVLRLTDTGKLGLGHFYLDYRHQNGILLQAPHQFFDKHTGRIARALFKEQAFAALAVNSVSRKKTDRAKHSLDLAHRDDTVFYAFSHAFMRVYAEAEIWQVHGFSQAKRKSRRAREAEMIVSLGGALPDMRLQKSITCLRQHFGEVLSYPDQVLELGGTRNLIGQLARVYPRVRFLHLEWSGPFREKLKTSSDHRAQVYQCLKQ